jgi:hypothetical protein
MPNALSGLRQRSAESDGGSAFALVIAELAQIRDPRGPLIGSLVFESQSAKAPVNG